MWTVNCERFSRDVSFTIYNCSLSALGYTLRLDNPKINSLGQAMTQHDNSGDYLGAERDELSVPVRGESNPNIGNAFTERLATAVLSLFGWRLAGRIPNLAKLVIVGAPHTSNWDWVLVMFAAYALGIRISWLGKHTAFKSPLGWMFRYFGGIPVDRRAPGGIVSDSVAKLKQAKKLALCITPEGTRGKVGEWKKGFYYIAQQAKVPVLLASFDYGRKVVGFGPTLYPTNDIEAELRKIQSLYKSVQAKKPSKF